MTDSATVAIQRVRTVLERELSKRRQNQSNGVGIEGLGEEDADRSEWGGLECSDAGGMFKFDGWEGGEISFLATSVAVGKPLLDEKTGSGLAQLTDLLEENF
jgi:signal recognition particle receptor subunit beta